MPRPKRITQSGAGVSNPVPLDHRNTSFDVTLACWTSGGAYTVELTTDDVQAADYDPATGNWESCAEIGEATENAMARLASGVTAVRLNVTSGDVRLDILHS